MKKLLIYYDNPNEASDMYLKWLKKDLDKEGINYVIVENYDNFCETLKGETPFDIEPYRVLPMMPVEDERVIDYLAYSNNIIDKTWLDIDNVGGSSKYKDATAEGIYNHIVSEFPDRTNTISVIGRGKVGKPLIDMLIDYGYTVCEFNSKSNLFHKNIICMHSDIIVGLSTETVFSSDDCERFINDGIVLIDANNTFNTDGKTRCGKWTREVLLSRLKED